MTTITTILVLLAVLALTAALAKRLPIPLPLLLILAGVAIAFVPGFEQVEIEPEVFFVLFISPLLFADGWITIPVALADGTPFPHGPVSVVHTARPI